MLQTAPLNTEREHLTDSSHSPTLPKIFCWTKMGAEAGQELSDILRRKELERRACSGTFAWGIGNSLGTAATEAQVAIGAEGVDVVFTPMKSLPKTIDQKPSELLLWLSYIDKNNRIVDLPTYTLVTSRGGNNKRAHYALLCQSDAELNIVNDEVVLDADCVVNFRSQNPVGASQVTAVVRYNKKKYKEPLKPYNVAFRARMHKEGFVRLARPILITNSLMDEYYELCFSKNVREWKERVGKLKKAAKELMLNKKRCQAELF